MTLPASPPVEWGAASHPGRMRTANEDAFLANPTAGLWAVADGMGGHAHGQLAAATVVEALGRVVAPESAAALLADCVDQVVAAHARLRVIAAESGATVGTTLAVLLVFGADYACIWSGDSRIYRARDATIEQLSQDHTEVQELVERGVLSPDEARVSPRRHVITRAIGIAPEPELDLDQGAIEPGDAFLLCSDGLTAHVAEGEIRDILGGLPPQGAADALVALALDRGGSDNVTVVVARCREVTP